MSLVLETHRGRPRRFPQRRLAHAWLARRPAMMFSLGAILSSRAVSGDTIIFGSADGNRYAIQ